MLLIPGTILGSHEIFMGYDGKRAAKDKENSDQQKRG